MLYETCLFVATANINMGRNVNIVTLKILVQFFTNDVDAKYGTCTGN